MTKKAIPTQRMNISGFVYVKDPKDQKKIDDLSSKNKHLAESNRTLAAENKRLIKLVYDDENAANTIKSLSELLKETRWEIKKYVEEINRVFKMKMYDLIEVDRYSSDAAIAKIDSVLGKMKKVAG